MLAPLFLSIKPTPGVEKRVMGYPTPPRSDSSPEAQATELLPGQGTLELVSSSLKAKPMWTKVETHG